MDRKRTLVCLEKLSLSKQNYRDSNRELFDDILFLEISACYSEVCQLVFITDNQWLLYFFNKPKLKTNAAR